MNDADVLKSLFVSLGFRVDAAGLKKFSGAIKDTSEQATGLAAGVTSAAAKVVAFAGVVVAGATAIFAATNKIASGLDKLYFAAQRIGASAENIQAFTFAISQMGASSEEAMGSLEGVAKFMATNPGGEGIIHSLGIQTRQANGELRDTVDIMADLGEKFKAMPLWMANSRAAMLGIDYKTLRAMREGTAQFGSEYKEILQAMGLDSEKATKNSRGFRLELAKIQGVVKAIALNVGGTFAGRLQPTLERIEKWLIAHGPQIRKVTGLIFQGFDILVTIIERLGEIAGSILGYVINAFQSIDGAMRKLLVTAALLVGALVLLSSPLLAIAALGTALFLLWDDYQTWKRGGKSLIDWSAWDGQIQSAIKGITELRDAITGLVNVVAHMLEPAIDKVGEKLKGFAKDAAGPLIDAVAKASHWTARKLGGGSSPKSFSDDEKQYGLPFGLLDKVFTAESSRGKNLLSPKGAMGPFQFMPNTAKQYGVDDPNDLQQSALGASKYLAHLMAHYGGNIVKSVAAYNWGEGNLDRFGLEKAPKETHDYISKVLGSDYNPVTAELLNARAGVTPGASVVIHQTNTTTVNAKSDPVAIGKAVGAEQVAANSQLTRNLKGRIQ